MGRRKSPHSKQLRIAIAYLKRPRPSAAQRVQAEIAELTRQIDAVPEDKRLCCNPAWYKAFSRRAGLTSLLHTLVAESL